MKNIYVSNVYIFKFFSCILTICTHTHTHTHTHIFIYRERAGRLLFVTLGRKFSCFHLFSWDVTQIRIKGRPQN